MLSVAAGVSVSTIAGKYVFKNAAGEVILEANADAVDGLVSWGKRTSGGNADFYVAPNGKVLPGEYKDWIGTNMRDSVINSVDDVKLKNAIGEVHRPDSIIGDGGTADVIRFGRETGILLSKSGHVQKV